MWQECIERVRAGGGGSYGKTGWRSERGHVLKSPAKEFGVGTWAFSLTQWRAIRAVVGCWGHLAPKGTFVNGGVLLASRGQRPGSLLDILAHRTAHQGYLAWMSVVPGLRNPALEEFKQGTAWSDVLERSPS